MVDRTGRWAIALLGVAVGLWLIAATPAFAWTVSSAELQSSGKQAVMRLTGEGLNGPPPYDVFTLEEPWRVIIDLFGADAPVPPKDAGASGPTGSVQGVRCSLWKAGAAGSIVRYVLDCDAAVQFHVETSTGALAVFVEPASGATAGGHVNPALHAEGTAGSDELDKECAQGQIAPPTDSGRFADTGTNVPALAASRFEDTVPAAPMAAPDQVASTAPAGLMTLPGSVVEAPPADPMTVPGPVADAAPAGLKTTSNKAAVAASVAAQPIAASRTIATASAVVPAGGSLLVSKEGGSAPEPQDAAPSLGSVDAGSAPSDGTAREMNLDVQGADIRTVLRSIAEYGGANIVADREVEGPVTVRLTKVPWPQALAIVCQSAGLVTAEVDGVIRVATAKTLREEGLDQESAERKREELQPLQTRVFNVRYASATELKDAIAFVLSKRGSANVDERTNTLLVSDIEPRIAEVDKLVQTLDTETRQVEITARLVDVDRTVARQLGIQWNLDNLHSDAQRASGSVKITELPAAASGTARIGVVRGFGALDATIEALERANQATLISSPKITTVNNRKAKILVGQEVPLIVLDVAGNPTTELKRVGISLEVTPYINSENRITMDLKPEVSDLSSQATVQGGIVFNTTLADTRVMVNDGETAVIGGLIRTSETDFAQGVPVLRSLPLIGALFRSTDKRKENRELLIFVSPKVVEGMAERH